MITKRTMIKYLGAGIAGGVTGRVVAETMPDKAGDVLAGLYHARGQYTDIPREEFNKITTQVVIQRPDMLAVTGAGSTMIATLVWDLMAPK